MVRVLVIVLVLVVRAGVRCDMWRWAAVDWHGLSGSCKSAAGPCLFSWHPAVDLQCTSGQMAQTGRTLGFVLPLTGPAALLPVQLRDSWALLYVKQYDPEQEKLSYVGRLWVMKSYKGEQVQQVICKLLQIPNQELEIYEVGGRAALWWCCCCWVDCDCCGTAMLL